MNGFYVPDSVSSSYVANKQNEEGQYIYEGAANQLGIQKQAALQQLEKNYASTIENAYASYLAANRGVQGSNMGQGYKELYNQIQQQQLAENVASAGSQFAQQAQSVAEQEAAAQQQIQQQFQQEVSYFDRVQQSFADYLTYVKSLTNAEGEGYLDPYENQQTVESMYTVLHEAEPLGSFDEAGNPLGYFDESGKAGLRYEDWVRSQLKDTDKDIAFSQWMFGGGLNEFLAAPKSTKQWQTGELKAVREEDKALSQDIETYKAQGKASDRVLKYLAENPEKAAEIENARFDKIYGELKRSKEYGTDTNLGNYVLTQLPNFDNYSDAEKSWLKITSGAQFGGKANLGIEIRESMLTEETKKWLADNGFKNVVKTTPNTFGGAYNKIYTYYTDAMTTDQLKEFYRKLYDSSSYKLDTTY